ncbi:MAG: hypothetical protein AAF533_11985 [Acidobacteriota bacterium]
MSESNECLPGPEQEVVEDLRRLLPWSVLVAVPSFLVFPLARSDFAPQSFGLIAMSALALGALGVHSILGDRHAPGDESTGSAAGRREFRLGMACWVVTVVGGLLGMQSFLGEMRGLGDLLAVLAFVGAMLLTAPAVTLGQVVATYRPRWWEAFGLTAVLLVVSLLVLFSPWFLIETVRRRPLSLLPDLLTGLQLSLLVVAPALALVRLKSLLEHRLAPSPPSIAQQAEDGR